MSGHETDTNAPGTNAPGTNVPDRAREALKQAETGDTEAAARVGDARETTPSDVEAVEQEASEGPAGLSR